MSQVYDLTTAEGCAAINKESSSLAKNLSWLAITGIPFPALKELFKKKEEKHKAEQLETFEKVLVVAKTNGLKTIKVKVTRVFYHDGEVQGIFKKLINIKGEWNVGEDILFEGEFK
jgi:CRISPR/Cas system-associated protein Csx1